MAAIVLSPQYSPLLMGGCGRAIDAARAELGPDAPQVTVANAWHLEPEFIAALAGRIRQALDRFSMPERDRVPVLLTAHSLPRRVADHLEVLYDVDIGACEQAKAQGLAFARIESLNTDPRFIAALGAVARRTIAATANSRRLQREATAARSA